MPKGKNIIWVGKRDAVILRSTVADAARKLGLGVSAIKNRRTALKADGLTSKVTGHRGPKGPTGPREDAREIIRLIGSGLSLTEIARRCDVSRQYVHQVRNRYSES